MRSSLYALGAAFVFGVGGNASAQLAANSPFLPPQNSGAAAPAANVTLEFRGVMQNANEPLEYRLVDPTKRTGVWLKLNEKSPELGVLVKQYDADHKTLTVEQDGRTLKLEERQAKIASAGAAPMMMPVPMTSFQPPAPTQPVTLPSTNTSSPEEARRLEEVAKEVAARRALREQAAQQGLQGIPPQAVRPAQPNQPVQTLPGRAGVTAPRQR
jgi:hypothetical protein